MSKQFVIGIIFLLCLSSVQSVTNFLDNTVDYDATMCPTSGPTKAFANKRLVANPNPPTSSTTIIPAIDGVSYVKDTGNDNVEIRYSITGLAGAWVIEFKSTSASTVSAPKTSTKSAISSTAKPVAKIFDKNVLVTKEDLIYVAYVIDPTTDHSAMTTFVTLGLPTTAYPGTTSVSEFRFLSVTAGTNPIVTVYAESTAPSAWADFIDYTITPATPSVADAKSNTVFGTYASKPLNANLIGLAQLYLDRSKSPGTGVFQYTTANGYAAVSGPLLATFNPADDQVFGTRLGLNLNVLVVRKSDKLKANIIYGTSSATITASNVKYITTTTNGPVKYYTDKVHNLLVVSDYQLNWINNVGTIITAAVQQSGGWTGDDLKIHTTNRVSLAGDKAFALLSTEIVSFQIISNTVVSLYKAIALTGTDIPGATSSIDVTITISCQCKVVAIKRFTCFATTLTCLSTVDALWSITNCSA